MTDKIMLWQGSAPDSDVCGDQHQPSITHFGCPNARGAVIVCPGGGYYMKAEYEGTNVCRALRQGGINAFLLDYRVRPCRPDTPEKDLKRAIRMARALGYEKVGVMGFSAGGHMCACAAVHYDRGDPKARDPVERFSSRPDVFVPCYGLFSFKAYANVKAVQFLLGEEWQNPQWRDYLTPCEQVTQDTPPAFIWHTASDTIVDVQNALLMCKALADCHVPFEMHVYPEGPHGQALAPEWANISPWMQDCLRFLRSHGFGNNCYS